MHHCFLSITDEIIEGIKALDYSADVHGLTVKSLLQADEALFHALFHRILLDWVNLRIDIDCKHVLEFSEFALSILRKAMKVEHDQTELGTVNVRIFVVLYALEGASHDGYHHVEDNQERD